MGGGGGYNIFVMVSNNFSPRKNLKTVWRNIAVAVFAVCFAILGLCVTVLPTRAADNNNYIVGEIYGQHANVQQMYNLITGKENATYDDVVAAATTVTNAATMREYNNDNDIKVTFGGKEWYAVYLSQTNETNPRPILTLWLAEAFTTAQWNKGTEYSRYYVYPNDMYATSYVRTEILNNAGAYSTDEGKTLNNTVTPNPNHAMANFSVDNIASSVTDVIVKPTNVEWQRAGQKLTYVTAENDRYNCKNENWGEEPEDGWTTQYWYPDGGKDPYTNNYSDIPGYGDWQNDYLWLPSLHEFEYYWVAKNLGSCWVRTGAYNYHGFVGYLCQGVSNNLVSLEREIRPALHIDLSATALLADWPQGEPTDVTVTYDPTKEQTIEKIKPAWYDPAMMITYSKDGETVPTVKDAGTYTATVQLNDMTKDITVTVTKQAITVEGLKVKDKTYNGTQKADFDTNGVKLKGSYTIDDVSIIPDGKFTDKNVGEKSVPVTISLTGKNAHNYVLTNPEIELKANITPCTVSISGITVRDKTYDGTATAFLDTSKIDYTNIVDGDDLTVLVTGEYVQDNQPYRNVGNGIKVALTYQGLDGKDAGNYIIATNNQKDVTGNISPRFIVVTVNHQTVKVGDPLKALTARVTSGSLVDPADEVYELGIKTDPDVDVDHLPVGEYEITGKGINDNYDIDFVDGKYTVLTVEAWEALQTTEEKDGNNAWLIIVIVIAIAAFVGALVGVGLVIRSHDKNREPKPTKEPKPKKNKATAPVDDQRADGATSATAGRQ